MNNIFKIQEIDGEIIKLKRSINNSIENKQLNMLSDIMREGKSFIKQTENSAEQLLKEFNELKRDYEKQFGNSEITLKQKIENTSIDNIHNLIVDTNGLAGNFAEMEQMSKNLNERIQRLLNDYKSAMTKLKITKEKYNFLKEKVSKLEQGVQPQVEKFKEQIAVLAKDADPEMYEIYKKLRQDNVYPVFVRLENNRCGGCKMEMSLNFIEKLKGKKMLHCEECRRIIINDSK
ncbi:MAG: hypothetical protein PHP83_00570 [Clostridia bacterium]|nr:hypothetical protein [Clostridia bacterium]